MKWLDLGNTIQALFKTPIKGRGKRRKKRTKIMCENRENENKNHEQKAKMGTWMTHMATP